MLRRGVRRAVAECSYGLRIERNSIARLSAAKCGPNLAQSLERLSLPRPTEAFVSRAFGTSSKKGKERESITDEEEDAVIDLISLMMKKRDVLMRRKDWTLNVEVAKQVSELDALHKLWEEWQKVNKVSPPYTASDRTRLN
jgi:hypothetical protein